VQPSARWQAGGTITWAVKSAPWPDNRASLEYCAAVIPRAPVDDGAPRIIATIRDPAGGGRAVGDAGDEAAA
jgi:hypothetical protein